MTIYPREIEDGVYFCGFASPKSYGAQSYLIRHPAGNWMTDSPRWNEALAARIEELGGLRYLFLTHRDDVADAEGYARRFGAQRIIHEADAGAAPGAEIVLSGRDPVELVPGFVVIPVPGHTRGHCVLLYKDEFLFAGDHLDADPATQTLEASRDFCWYDWAEQTESMKRLLGCRFEWVLPGHGRRLKLPPRRMREELSRLIGRMAAGS